MVEYQCFLDFSVVLLYYIKKLDEIKQEEYSEDMAAALHR